MKHLLHYKLFEIEGKGWVCSLRFYKGTSPIEIVELSYYTSPTIALKAGMKYFDKLQ